jgi:hypothetical protein
MDAAIPTVYRNQRFRSLLEARWASFFDELGWGWEYEPFELAGYIPDFALCFHKPILVEVKPTLVLDDLRQHAAKIDRSGWKHEALIVGARLFPWHDEKVCLGLTRDFSAAESQWGSKWSEGILNHCTNCDTLTFIDANLSFHCRSNGCWDGDHYLSRVLFEGVMHRWRQATNKVQWNPKL